jgi:hypothetical protein
MITGGKVTFKTPSGFEHKSSVVELTFDSEADLDRAAALAQKKALEMVGLSSAGIIIPPATVQKQLEVARQVMDENKEVLAMLHDEHGPATPAPDTKPVAEKTTVRKMPGKTKAKEEPKADIVPDTKPAVADALGDVPQIRTNPEDRKEPEAKVELAGADLGGDAPLTDKDLGDLCNRAAGKLLTTHGAEASKKVRELIQKYAPRVAEIPAEKRKAFKAELEALK